MIVLKYQLQDPKPKEHKIRNIIERIIFNIIKNSFIENFIKYNDNFSF